MKKVAIIASVFICTALQTFAQGQFNFSNIGLSPAALVYVGSVGSGVLTDNTYDFNYVYALAPNATASQLTSIGLATPKVGMAGGEFLGGTQTFANYTGTITLQIQAWKAAGGSTYAQAVQNGAYAGESSIMQVALGNPQGSPPGTATKLGGILSSFAVTTPEPSTIALAVIGLSVLLFRRRK